MKCVSRCCNDTQRTNPRSVGHVKPSNLMDFPVNCQTRISTSNCHGIFDVFAMEFDVFAMEFDETERMKIEASRIFPDPMEYTGIQHQIRGSRDVCI